MRKKSPTLLFGTLCFFFLITPFTFLQAQEVTTFILVRHAEKMEDGTKDPGLNQEGLERAASLAEHLRKTEITAVYSTPYERTRSTVDQIAQENGLTIEEYNPFADDLVQQMMEQHKGGIILISGHSNTTPSLVNQLMGRDIYKQLEESEYENLYMVSLTEIGNGQVIHLTY